MSNQENLPRNFKGIWIPKEIWIHTELDFFEKCLWAEINSLDDDVKGCTASNEYLAKFFNVREKTIQRGISKLKRLGFVKLASYDGRRRILRASIKDIFYQADRTKETPPDKFDQSDGPDLSGGGTPTHIDIERKDDYLSCRTSETEAPTTQDSSSLEIAKELWRRVVSVHPKAKLPNLNSWAKDIDLAMRIDGRSKEDLLEVIRYAFEDDPFWFRVLQSGKKLREKFDQIWMKRIPATNKGGRIEANMQSAREAKALLVKDNKGYLLTIFKNSVQNQNGESVSLDLPPETFDQIICNWFGWRIK